MSPRAEAGRTKEKLPRASGQRSASGRITPCGPLAPTTRPSYTAPAYDTGFAIVYLAAASSWTSIVALCSRSNETTVPSVPP